jgi:hypothetical protein
MIKVRFASFDFHADTKQWTEVPVAELVADGQEVAIGGPHADWINLDIAIVDPSTGKQVTRDDGAEYWAQLLPFAYRNGDLVVEVTKVDEVTKVAIAEPVGAVFRYSARG